MSKISTSVRGNENFLAKTRKLPTLPTSLDIFDIKKQYIRILYLLRFKSHSQGLPRRFQYGLNSHG